MALPHTLNLCSRHMTCSTAFQIRLMKLSEFQDKHEGDLTGPALEEIKQRQQALKAQLTVPPATGELYFVALRPESKHATESCHNLHEHTMQFKRKLLFPFMAKERTFSGSLHHCSLGAAYKRLGPMDAHEAYMNQRKGTCSSFCSLGRLQWQHILKQNVTWPLTAWNSQELTQFCT